MSKRNIYRRRTTVQAVALIKYLYDACGMSEQSISNSMDLDNMTVHRIVHWQTRLDVIDLLSKQKVDVDTSLIVKPHLLRVVSRTARVQTDTQRIEMMALSARLNERYPRYYADLWQQRETHRSRRTMPQSVKVAGGADIKSPIQLQADDALTLALAKILHLGLQALDAQTNPI